MSHAGYRNPHATYFFKIPTTFLLVNEKGNNLKSKQLLVIYIAQAKTVSIWQN